MNSALAIIIPVYNARETIARTILSLRHLSQPAQVLLVNDGSTDDTVAIAEQAAKGMDAVQLRVLPGQHAGLPAARNIALRHCQSPWLLMLDGDDELHFDPFAHLAQAGDATCIGMSVDFQRRGKIVRRLRPTLVHAGNHRDVFSAGNPFTVTSVLFRHDCVDVPFDEGLAFGEDWSFWLHNPRVFARMRCQPEITAAIIHLRADSICSNYARAGRFRGQIAQEMLEQWRDSITRKQRNNLLIQQQIGLLQQGKRLVGRGVLRLPCSPALYGKLWIYAAAALLGLTATLYR